MYAAVRPVLRSSSLARPARFRYLRAYRLRSLHSTRYLGQSSNPPSPPETPPIADNGGPKSDPEKKGEAEEPRSDAVVAEDPEVLAQKLQRAKESTRRYTAALKRSQRRNRNQDLPPIDIPDWFLRRNVRLREALPSFSHDAVPTTYCALSLSEEGTGDRGTCLIPFQNYKEGIRNASRMVKAMWDTGLAPEQRKEFARDFLKRTGLPDNQTQVASLEPLEQKEENTTDTSKDQQHLATPERFAGKKVQEELKMMRQAEAALSGRGHQQADPRVPSLVLAEIRATVAASLASTQPAVNNTFPASKSNLILHAPTKDHGPALSSLVQNIASELEADLVTLNVQDLAQLLGDYLGDGPEPSPHSVRSLAYETYRLDSYLSSGLENVGREEGPEDGQYGDGSPPPTAGIELFPDLFSRSLGRLGHLMHRLQTSPQSVMVNVQEEGTNPSNRVQSKSESQLEDMKIAALLAVLVDSNQMKRALRQPSPSSSAQSGSSLQHSPLVANQTEPPFFDFSSTKGGTELDFTSAIPGKPWSQLKFTVKVETSSRRISSERQATIVHVPDIKELNATNYGSRILEKLEDIVRQRRAAGENIMILGTTSSVDLVPELSSSGLQSLQYEGESGLFRTIVVPVGDGHDARAIAHLTSASAMKNRIIEDHQKVQPSSSDTRRVRNINLRHIESMLRSLDPAATSEFADMEQNAEPRASFAHVLPDAYSSRILTFDEVHRLSLIALGLHFQDPRSSRLSWAHVVLAMGILKCSDAAKSKYINLVKAAGGVAPSTYNLLQGSENAALRRMRRQPGAPNEINAVKHQQDLERIRMTANKHEKNLIHGIANPDQLKTTFDRVHVPKETIEAVRTLTSLSLLRPDAFNYGVLATDKISGILLYGPPGTGKTLLARAVAKESGSTVLEVSGSEINDKYVGEGEKNVRAIFTLAQKLSPCIVFLDEADAILGARDNSRQRVSHRDILNQFLKEWDGLNDHGVFVMVASNRPFDLDDAVIRRLPRRVLVDLPTEVDRREILKIHLRDEQIDSSVDLGDLAKRTPLYSGSDLKNLAVSAALACVREENEQAAIAAAEIAAGASEGSSSTEDGKTSSPSSSPKDTDPPQLVRGQKYDFPEKRTLHIRHFEKALQEVSASISEDMSSLNAIKKFDEQYGDRKGRRKKKAYGFGVAQEKIEEAARVRS